MAHQAAGFRKDLCDRFVSGDQRNHVRGKHCRRRDELAPASPKKELMERRANKIPTSSTITMRGVKARSGMNSVVGKVRQARHVNTRHG